MASQFPNTNVYYYYASLAFAPDPEGDLTVSFWARIDTATPSQYGAFFARGTSGANNFFVGVDNTNGLVLYAYVGGLTTHTGPTLVAGTWYHIAITKNGNDHVVYLNGVPVITFTETPSVITSAQFWISRSANGVTGENILCTIQNVKLWTASLTADEVRKEGTSWVPVRVANIFADWQILKWDATDYSTAGHNLSANTTVTVVDGPPLRGTPGP